jgi:UTP--glucose-1-phosphate uridylyltransferase
VKTTDDLLVLRSDFYSLADDGELVPARPGDEPFVALDSSYYKLLADFERRFPRGVPSLKSADRLEVHGDVTFGANVTVTGEAEVRGPAQIPDNARLPSS